MSYIPDGQRCLICHGRARNGAIVHTPKCPEWTAPGRRTPATAGERRQAAAEALERYERFVSKLGSPHRRDRYECPRCGDTRHGGLKVEPGADGSVLFWCFECCQKARDDRATLDEVRKEILEAVGLRWGDVLPGRPLTVFTVPAEWYPDRAVAR